MTVVRRRACSTCVFRKGIGAYFDPETLDATAGENLRTGYAHRCHQHLGKERELVCAGFARLVKELGAHNAMLDLAQRLGLYDPERDTDNESQLEVSSWDAVLAMHRKRCS